VKPGITRFFALLIALVLSTSGFAQTGTTARNDAGRGKESASKPASGKRVTSEMIEGDLREALSVVEQNYASGKSINYNDVVKNSIDAMLHTLDPHSNYFDAKEYDQFKTDQSSRYFGIGATIGDLSDAEGNVLATYIKATFEGAPAYKAGLRYGDKIIEVNGKSMLGKPFSEVRNNLRGPQGTTAKLVVERLDGKRLTVEIIRDAVPQPSISEIYMIRPGVGYMRMDGGFNQTTFNEFAGGFRELKAQGMTQLIMDLRGNGGGLVSRAYQIANAFLGKGQTVFTQKGRVEGVTEQYEAQNPTPDRSPIVMLVDRNTASASEILAGALQDHDRALIVGENTFGKGLVQNPFQLDYGSMLLLTIAKYETPSGRLIQRDYSNGDLYNYYTEGGSLRDDNAEAAKPKGQETKTDTGRSVYGGGGINPDVVVKAATIPIERFNFETKLTNPIVGFAFDLTQGKIQGLENYKINSPINFEYDIKATDYPVNETVFAALKKYAVEKYKYTPVQIDRERQFIERILRTELITAAYGSQTARQVGDEYDNQILKAIDLLPQAKQLAIAGERARATAANKQRNTSN
jgi:carboxyl-terminal processing protease